MASFQVAPQSSAGSARVSFQLPPAAQGQQRAHAASQGGDVFDRLDRKHDGYISRSELDQPVGMVMARALSDQGGPASPGAVAASLLFDMADRNNDGVVSRS